MAVNTPTIPTSKRTQRIIDRLPRFYSAWDARSVIFRLISALSNSLDHQERQLYNIMKAHWVDTARGFDLDLLGFIFNLNRRPTENDDVFRKRIKHAIADYRGGGTVSAIKEQVRDYLGLDSDPFFREYPRIIQVVKKKNYLHNDSWFIANRSRCEVEEAVIVLTVGTGGQAEIENPTITATNNDTGGDGAHSNSSKTLTIFRYRGKLSPGDRLEIRDQKAFLYSQKYPEGRDISDKVGDGTSVDPIFVTRSGSTWKYEEATSIKAGRFDVSRFDVDEFATEVPPIDITIKWSAELLAAFEIRVPLSAMQKKGVTKRNLEGIVNSIKAAGIMAIVTVDKEK